MKKRLSILVFLILSAIAGKAQSLYYPPNGANAAWDTAAPASLGWCTTYIDSLYGYLGATQTRGFILLKDGKIVLEKYFGTFTKDSVWYWASAGKTLTAATIGIAQGEGMLSVEDSTVKYLKPGWTACTPAAERAIRIRHQLTMTSGFDDGVPDSKCTLPACLQCIAAPGTRWAYHNGPYTLLQAVLDSATGNFNTCFNQKLRNPIGMNGVWIVRNGYDHVYYSSPRSAARFGLLILGKGAWNGTRIIKDTAFFSQMISTSQQLNPSYGYLWWLNGKSSFRLPGTQHSFSGALLPHAPADLVAAMGQDGQMINVVPSKGLVMVRMGAAASADAITPAYNDTIWIKLNAVMCNPASITAGHTAGAFSAYPIPADNTIHFMLPAGITGNYRIDLYDIAGRLITGQLNLPFLKVGGIAEGLYLVRLESAGGTWQSRVLIRH